MTRVKRLSKSDPNEKFSSRDLWSGDAFRKWERESLRFFKLWAPLLLVSGVSGGLGAVFFRLLIILNQDFFFGFLETHGVSIIFLPVIGGLVVGPIIYKWASEAWGHGVPEVMDALVDRGGRIRARVAAVKIAVSSITIGSGGSAGREGPIAQIGASVSSIVGQLVHLDERSLKLLVMAGASAGISGTFKAPIGGALFGLEVLNKKMRTTDLVVMVFSSIVGYAVSVGILGPAPIFTTESIVLRDVDIPFYVVLGLIGGLVSYAWTRSLYGVEELFARLRISVKWFSPFIGSWVVGGIGLFFPEALGLGYNVMSDLFAGTIPIAYTGSLALFFILLFLAKLGTSSFTIGSGGSGGVFSPSLFMGAMVGAVYGIAIDSLFPAVSPGYRSFALVGMAVVFAGAAKAPLMSTIIVGEMSHNYTMLPGILIACVVSYLVSGPGSIYVFKLMKEAGREIPDEYLDTPRMPAIIRFAQNVMSKDKQDTSETKERKVQKSERGFYSATKTTTIKATAEKIFEVCDNPESYSFFVPGLEKVSYLYRTEQRVGDSFKVTYSSLGSRMVEVVQFNLYERPKSIGVKFQGEFDGEAVITLVQGKGETEVMLHCKHLITKRVMEMLKDRSLAEIYDNELELLLENLKTLCELNK